MFHSTLLTGKKIAESYSKSPDINSWGAPVLLKAEIPLRMDHGEPTPCAVRYNLSK